VISKSQLARYEAGDTLLSLELADQLDELYEAKGWVQMALRSLWRSKWDPWAGDRISASRFHAGAWPARFGGIVWIKLGPQTSLGERRVALKLEWGPWGRTLECPLTDRGIVLMTGKAIDADGISRTLNLTSSEPVYALFGAGDDLGRDDVIDIRRGWEIVTPGAAPGESDHGPEQPGQNV
jgi:hypothetical protein